MNEKSTEASLELVAARVAGVGLTVARRRKKPKKGPKKPKRTTKKPTRRKKSPKKAPKSRRRTSQPKPAEADITQAPTEYACRADLSFSIDFEGRVGKQQLVKAFEAQIRDALKSTASTLARGFQLSVNSVQIGPFTVDCAVTDSTGIEEMID